MGPQQIKTGDIQFYFYIMFNFLNNQMAVLHEWDSPSYAASLLMLIKVNNLGVCTKSQILSIALNV